MNRPRAFKLKADYLRPGNKPITVSRCLGGEVDFMARRETGCWFHATYHRGGITFFMPYADIPVYLEEVREP